MGFNSGFKGLIGDELIYDEKNNNEKSCGFLLSCNTVGKYL